MSHLWPGDSVRKEEEPDHCVCEGLDAASVNVLLLVLVQEVKGPLVHLSWGPVLSWTTCRLVRDSEGGFPA